MIEINSASVKYSKKQLRYALESVSLTVQSEKVVIVGPNGSGKTTVLKLLLGLARISKGEAKVMGKNVLGISNDVSLSTNLPETYRLVKGTVRDIVKVYAELRGGDPNEALRTMEDFNLAETFGSQLFALSSGQQKMVCNILALSFSPKIVLLDEPFDNIDQSGRLKLLHLIINLDAEIILNTHEFDLLNRLMDWGMYFIIEGKLFGKFKCAQLRSLYINRDEVPGNIAVMDTSFGKFSITENSGTIPIASARNLNSLFDEVAR